MIEDKSYGVIVVFENKFLIIQQKLGYWSFPKGHSEGAETAKEAAIRELAEETGITHCNFLDLPSIFGEYTFTWDDGKEYHKIVEYFIGLAKDNKVIIQEDEILDYQWLAYEEALQTVTYDNNKEILKIAQKYLDEYESRK